MTGFKKNEKIENVGFLRNHDFPTILTFSFRNCKNGTIKGKREQNTVISPIKL